MTSDEVKAVIARSLAATQKNVSGGQLSSNCKLIKDADAVLAALAAAGLVIGERVTLADSDAYCDGYHHDSLALVRVVTTHG